jgi:hypothetical protein
MRNPKIILFSRLKVARGAALHPRRTTSPGSRFKAEAATTQNKIFKMYF